MKRLTPYSWLILIIFSSCLTGNKVASTDKQIEKFIITNDFGRENWNVAQ